MTLCEHAPVHLLPACAVMLDYGLIRHAEGCLGGMAPVGGIQTDRVLVEGLASAAQGEEALCVQVGEYEYKDVEWKIGKGGHGDGGLGLGMCMRM